MLDIAEPDDRVIVCNSFSKTWVMTGWRLGWLVVPEGTRDADHRYRGGGAFRRRAVHPAGRAGGDRTMSTRWRFPRPLRGRAGAGQPGAGRPERRALRGAGWRVLCVPGGRRADTTAWSWRRNW